MKIKRSKSAADKSAKVEAFTSLFRHFRRILSLNNQILEMTADLERALGGEYIYDRSFLKTSVSGIIEKGRQVIYHLNTITSNRYTRLYDQFTLTSDHLTDILAGGPGPFGPQQVLAADILHRDLPHLAGGKGANLGEIKNGLQIPTPALFVLSTTGYRHFMESNDLFSRINAILQETPDPAEQAARIEPLFQKAKVPADLNKTLTQAIKKLKRQSYSWSRFAVRSSAVGEDGERSFAGQFQSLLDVPANEIIAACVTVMASRFSEGLLRYLDEPAAAEEFPMAVVVQTMLDCQASGVLYTRDPNGPSADAMVVSAITGQGESLVGGAASGNRFVLGRKHPFALQSSTLAAIPLADENHADPMEKMDNGLRRGSGIIGMNTLRKLAEYGLQLEKRFEVPQDIEWCVDDQEQLWILQSRPLRLLDCSMVGEHDHLAEDLAALPVLLSESGHVCQLGMACGKAVLVEENTPPEDFPIGAIAISRYASPRLAEIIRRAAGIITDIGSPTGHLATIAREYRTPALFGTANATHILGKGGDIVLDVENRTVYQGQIELPVDVSWTCSLESHSENPEASILRRLLRLIAPLNLVDPAAAEFRPENCRTIHDFLRFCHENVVTALIDFHTSGQSMPGGSAPVLQADIPIRVRMIDVGGGLNVQETDSVRIEQVLCRPFQALLKGMLDQDFWDKSPAAFGMRDFFSSLTRPLTNAPAYSGENLAIIADDYCNLSLRLGYHFNIIDCYLCDEPDDNYIYFRFVGGFAEQGKRQRRAELISQILVGLHFKVEVKGDLVLGKAKMLERHHLENILTHIGQLVAFTRQLDVKMIDEAAVESFFHSFLDRIRSRPTFDDE